MMSMIPQGSNTEQSSIGLETVTNKITSHHNTSPHATVRLGIVYRAQLSELSSFS